MFKLFDKDFFRFFIGFAVILACSFLVFYLVQNFGVAGAVASFFR